MNFNERIVVDGSVRLQYRYMLTVDIFLFKPIKKSCMKILKSGRIVFIIDYNAFFKNG